MGTPNILLICTDQQRYDVLGAFGNPYLSTPAIDGLAGEGVRFDRCYTPSPVCAPARASLLTGLLPHAHGLWANGVALPGSPPMLGRLLADAGYDCGLVGKLHLAACFGGRDETRHDDGFRFFEWAHDPSHSSPNNRYHTWIQENFPELWVEQQAADHGAEGTTYRVGDDVPTEAHYSHWVAEQTIRYLQDERDPDKPFFFVSNFYDPHHPFVAPEEYVERFRGKVPEPIGPAVPTDDRPPIQRESSKASYAGNAPGFQDYTPEQIQDIVANYYAMVALIDDEVGRILRTLQEQGLAGDTLVIFTSDHGEMLGDHAQLLKGPLFYEGAVRVPLVMRWPGELPAGVVRDDLVQFHDLFATCLSAAEVAAPAYTHAMDLLPVARGAGPGRPYAITEYRNSGHPYEPPVHATMVRDERFKLVVHHGPPASERAGAGELYDLHDDPQELRNLWADPLHAATRAELTEQLLNVFVATENRTASRDAFW
ncbi:MAG TPA: sulfatase-like hydrolase/transferase [Mycobacteriales bacterium]|nr:sulfatase-like hydrolase/transferase [Mycobacteriales bacterium]